MKFVSPIVLLATILLAQAAQAQQATALNASVPLTAKVGASVTLSATLINAWTNGGMSAGYPVEISVGDQYSFSTTTFYTANGGRASRTWTFYTPGKYRVAFRFPGGWGYVDSRTTAFITVTK
jgi:hypothetical protein